MPSNQKKSKQQKKSQQQRQKDRKKEKKRLQTNRKNHQFKAKKHDRGLSNGNDFKRLSHPAIVKMLTKAYIDLDLDCVEEVSLSLKNPTFKQQILAEWFNILWSKCTDKTGQECTEPILTKKLCLMQRLIVDFRLNGNATSNFFSADETDTMHDRCNAVCVKCVLPMIALFAEFVDTHCSVFRQQLKSLVLLQMFHTLRAYVDSLGIKFASNTYGLVGMSWSNFIEPTLSQWWNSPYNAHCKALLPWAVSQGVYLDVVLPFYTDLKRYVLHAHATDPDALMKLNSARITMDPNDDASAVIAELFLPASLYQQLAATIGKSLVTRQQYAEDENVPDVERLYDADLEFVYYCIADLFDEGRLRWLRTDDGYKIYEKYVSVVNDCIDAEYPEIGKIVTYFLIGNIADCRL